jgi:hypothetical protein
MRCTELWQTADADHMWYVDVLVDKGRDLCYSILGWILLMNFIKVTWDSRQLRWNLDCRRYFG